METEPGRDELCERLIEAHFRAHPTSAAAAAAAFLADNAHLEPEISAKFRAWRDIRRSLDNTGESPDHATIEAPSPGDTYVAGGSREVTDTQPVRVLDSASVNETRHSQGDTLAAGRYRLIERLGRGQFGTVWKAHDTAVDRYVAVKILRNDLADDDFRQFQKDLVVGRLRHDNIVRVFDVGESGGTVHIVSELIEGQSLREWMKIHAENLSPRRVCRIVCQLADALDYAHGQGVVHRDIKPENILMHAGSDRPCLLDFGLALRVDDPAHDARRAIVGTIAYMAPEQASGDSHTADARTDVYALGAVLYEMLAGERPFRGRPDAILRQIRENVPPDPRRFQDNIPEHLVQICMKCLEKDRENRFLTAAHLRNEITRYLEDRPPGPGIRVTRWDLLNRWVRRNPIATALVSSFLVALMLTVGFGITGLSRALGSLDRGLTDRALSTNEAAARLAATQVSDVLVKEVDKIRDVAKSPELIADFEKIDQDRDLREILTRLHADDALAVEPGGPIRSADPELVRRHESDRGRLIDSKPIRALQERLSRLYQDDENNATFVFSWATYAANGIQIARAPVLQSLGKNYAWRSYFHGGPTDWERNVAGKSIDPPILRSPHISAVFMSAETNNYVIAISAPVIDDSGKPLGVIAKMLEFGKIVDIESKDANQLKFVIVDMRPGSRGVILQHPYFQKVVERENGRLMHDPFDLRFRVPLETILKPNPNYTDPIAQLDPAYKGRWIASAVQLRIRNNDSGIYMMTQVDHGALIGSYLDNLHSSLILLFLALIALVLTTIVPFWLWVLRNNATSR